MTTTHYPHPHLEVLVGIPGSGKTTYAIRLHAQRPTVHIVNPDTLRERLYPGYHEGRVEHHLINHRLIFRLAYQEVADALATGHDVIFDATSLTVNRRRQLILLGRRYHAVITARYFPISLREAYRRNSARLRQVPRADIAHMAQILQPPIIAEGFERIVIEKTEDGEQ